MILPCLQSFLKTIEDDSEPPVTPPQQPLTALDTVIQEAQPQNIISRFEIKTTAYRQSGFSDGKKVDSF